LWYFCHCTIIAPLDRYRKSRGRLDILISILPIGIIAYAFGIFKYSTIFIIANWNENLNSISLSHSRMKSFTGWLDSLRLL